MQGGGGNNKAVAMQVVDDANLVNSLLSAIYFSAIKQDVNQETRKDFVAAIK